MFASERMSDQRDSRGGHGDYEMDDNAGIVAERNQLFDALSPEIKFEYTYKTIFGKKTVRAEVRKEQEACQRAK